MAFLLLDPNPAVQWSVIDYWRFPKRSYYTMQKAFHPQYIFTVLEKDTYKVCEEIAVPIYIVNDSRESYGRMEVFAEVFNARGMRTLHAAFASSLEADSAAKLVQSVKFRFHSPGERRPILTLRYGEETFENEYRLLIEG